MRIEEQLDIESISETCMVSNTPKFLYKRLRANASVEQFAKKHTIESIAKNYRNLLRKKERTFDENALAYALLVALYFKDYAELKSVAKRLPVRSLRWGKELRDILLSSAISTAYSAFTMPHVARSSQKIITENKPTNEVKIIIASH